MSVGSCDILPELTVPHFTVPEAKALDIDRTLTQVPLCTDRILAVSEEFGLDRADILAAQQQHSGGRDPLRYVQEHLPPDDLAAWGQRYIELRTPSLTYDDTNALLMALNSRPAIPNVGVTYGTNPLLQVIKVAGAGCKLYIEILDHTDKGPHLDNWWHGPTANFVGRDEHGEPVAVYHAASVELVDDSDASMQNLSRRCTGARLVRPGEKRKAGQDGPVPEHLRDRVRTVSHLGEVSLLRDLQPAGCSPVDNPAAVTPQPTSFRPAYTPEKQYPGILVAPGMSFNELRATLDSLYA